MTSVAYVWVILVPIAVPFGPHSSPSKTTKKLETAFNKSEIFVDTLKGNDSNKM